MVHIPLPPNFFLNKIKKILTNRICEMGFYAPASESILLQFAYSGSAYLWLQQLADQMCTLMGSENLKWFPPAHRTGPVTRVPCDHTHSCPVLSPVLCTPPASPDPRALLGSLPSCSLTVFIITSVTAPVLRPFCMCSF